jgi:NADH-quinone oxidoreductase subunit M
VIGVVEAMVGLHIAVLAVLALAVAALKGREAVGLAAAAATLAVGLAGLATPSAAATWLVIDGLSLARVLVTGLVLLAVFAVLPRRHGAPRLTAALIGLAAAGLALVVLPGGPARAAVWALYCALAAAALPSGGPRRLALPHLALAALSGAAGEIVGGGVGAGLVLLAVAVATGVPPFHTWIVGAYTLAPMTGAVAVAAPLGAVALIARGSFGGGAPLAAALIGAALITGGLVVVQRELARAVGLLTVSVQTLVVLALADSDAVGHLGGLLLWCATAVALVGLGLVASALRSRLGRVPVDRHAGLASATPTFATLFLLFGLAAVGMPGTAGFASEDLVLHGALAGRPALLIGFAAAVSVQAYAVLHLFFRVFFGPAAGVPVADATGRERAALLLLAALVIGGGLAPQGMVALTSPPPPVPAHRGGP